MALQVFIESVRLCLGSSGSQNPVLKGGIDSGILSELLTPKIPTIPPSERRSSVHNSRNCEQVSWHELKNTQIR